MKFSDISIGATFLLGDNQTVYHKSGKDTHYSLEQFKLQRKYGLTTFEPTAVYFQFDHTRVGSTDVEVFTPAGVDSLAVKNSYLYAFENELNVFIGGINPQNRFDVLTEFVRLHPYYNQRMWTSAHAEFVTGNDPHTAAKRFFVEWGDVLPTFHRMRFLAKGEDMPYVMQGHDYLTGKLGDFGYDPNARKNGDPFMAITPIANDFQEFTRWAKGEGVRLSHRPA